MVGRGGRRNTARGAWFGAPPKAGAFAERHSAASNDEHMMIACCNDGTRPVIFKIERQDYLVVNTSGSSVDESEAVSRLLSLPNVSRAEYRKDKGLFEVFTDRNAPADEKEIANIFERLGADRVSTE